MEAILDASAVVAFLHREPGHEVVVDAVSGGAAMCAANVAEAVAVLIRRGLAPADATRAVTDLPVEFPVVDLDLALRAGAMEADVRRIGLSLADRICLALAIRHRVPAITTDRAWRTAAPLLGVEVRLIR